MQDSKELLEFYERHMVDDMCKLFHQVKNDPTLKSQALRTRLKLFGETIKRWDSLCHVFDAHHPEGSIAQSCD